jgi:hypothetical protein
MGMNPDTNKMEPLSPGLQNALDDFKEKAKALGAEEALSRFRLVRRDLHWGMA